MDAYTPEEREILRLWTYIRASKNPNIGGVHMPLEGTYEIASHTYRMKNAFVTIHEFSPETAIFNITAIKDGQHASIWVSRHELRELANLLHMHAESVCPE